MRRTRARILRRAPLALAALVVLVALSAALASSALATVSGGCTLRANSTSGGTVDLTTMRVWHLHSNDRVAAVASAPAAQTSVTVRAYAFGFAIPVTGGTSDGTTAADASDIDISTFAILGRVFAVSGTSAGSGGGCDGQVLIVLDDVNPFLTVLGIGGVVAIILGLLGVVWATRRPLSAGRRIAGFVALLLAGAGLGLVLQQTSTPPESAAAISSLGRSEFVNAVPTPFGVTVDPNALAQSALLTLLVLILLPFPSQLFNRTLEENYDEIRAAIRRRRLTAWLWRGRPAPPVEPAANAPLAAPAFVASPMQAGAAGAFGGVVPMVPPPPPPPPLPFLPPPPPPPPLALGPSGMAPPRRQESAGSAASRRLAAVAVVLVAGLLYGLLDPKFGADTRSAVTFAGTVLGLLAVTWAASLPHRALHRTLHGDAGRIWAPFGVLAIAALCVVISRLVGFLPGYLYGLILGYQFGSRLESRDESRAWTASAWWMLSLALVAWLTLGAVRMPGLEDSVPGEIAATVLAALVVAGVEALVFELVPIRFLPGEHVFRWQRLQWVVLFALGVFAFAWIILNPTNGFVGSGSGVSLFAAVGLFLAFGIVSVLFWGWFRLRRAREIPSAA